MQIDFGLTIERQQIKLKQRTLGKNWTGFCQQFVQMISNRQYSYLSLTLRSHNLNAHWEGSEAADFEKKEQRGEEKGGGKERKPKLVASSRCPSMRIMISSSGQKCFLCQILFDRVNKQDVGST